MCVRVLHFISPSIVFILLRSFPFFFHVFKSTACDWAVLLAACKITRTGVCVSDSTNCSQHNQKSWICERALTFHVYVCVCCVHCQLLNRNLRFYKIHCELIVVFVDFFCIYIYHSSFVLADWMTGWLVCWLANMSSQNAHTNLYRHIYTLFRIWNCIEIIVAFSLNSYVGQQQHTKALWQQHNWDTTTSMKTHSSTYTQTQAHCLTRW